MPEAYRIIDWWKYEITSKGRLATAKTPMKDIRKTPLVFVRFPVHGHSLTAGYRRMVRTAGELTAACDGVYKMLVGLAGDQVREFRGWILDDRQRILEPEQVAELLFLPVELVQEIYAILMCEDVKLLELVEFPKALCRPGKAGGKVGGEWSKAGVSMEKNGVALNETETEGRRKKRFEANRNEGGGVHGEKNMQPQALPAAQPSVSDTGPGSVAASDSEKLPASASDTVPDSDSVSQAGPRAGPGVESSSGLVSGERRIEIIREGRKAHLELTQIIHPHNTSDITTISDIYAQLQQRLIAGSPYPLFEYSLTTARQCWRADKPIAMFVAAMKKPPFYYVPKKLSVVPGKFSQDRR